MSTNTQIAGSTGYSLDFVRRKVRMKLNNDGLTDDGLQEDTTNTRYSNAFLNHHIVEAFNSMVLKKRNLRRLDQALKTEFIFPANTAEVDLAALGIVDAESIVLVEYQPLMNPLNHPIRLERRPTGFKFQQYTAFPFNNAYNMSAYEYFIEGPRFGIVPLPRVSLRLIVSVLVDAFTAAQELLVANQPDFVVLPASVCKSEDLDWIANRAAAICQAILDEDSKTLSEISLDSTRDREEHWRKPTAGPVRMKLVG